ncbi:MAG: methyltransferase domain-containing protein [Actinomycetota bacterium]|nr:methyltransferase domain-containing protein [Actinomycetota bacterium]
MGFAELKARQAQVWGSAPFEKIAETSPVAYDDLVKSLSPQGGERWLDVACGTGAIAFRAARAGAEVTGVDFAPELVETAKRLAGEEGLRLDLEVGDAENLPYGDASFDVVSSSFGVMFAPDQPRAAGELARVTRPGGRLGLNTWRPDGGVGRFFQVVSGFAPPPPEGAGRPLDWGREEHVRQLLGDAFELEFQEGDAVLEAESGEEVWELFSTAFGPVKTLAESLEGERREEFRRAIVDFHEGARANGGIRMERRYLVTTGMRR